MNLKANLLILLVPFICTINYGKSKNNLLQNKNWIKGKVGYEIYIDSFRNGNFDNDPIFNELGMENFSKPSGELRTGTLKENLVSGNWGDEYSPEFSVHEWNGNFENENSWEREGLNSVEKYNRYYGGDLKGIEEKLDYIKSLKIDYIILSSPFFSKSNHKYNPIYLNHIDPFFGNLEQSGTNKGLTINVKTYNKFGEKELDILKYNSSVNNLGENILDENTWVWTDSDLEFANLIKKIHEKGMKVIVEMSIDNTIGEYIPNKILDDDWYLDEKRTILNLKNKNVKKYIFNSIKKWITGPDGNLDSKNIDGIDGIKYVYINDENKENIKELNDKLIGLKEDLIIIDELNFDVVNNLVKYTLNTDQNYKINGVDFANELIKSNMNGKNELPIYLSSIDTDRIYSGTINVNRSFDMYNKNNDKYLDIIPNLYDKNAVEKLKRIVSIQMTMLNSPVIYYGDEKGMWGSDAPRNRKPMLWEDFEPYEFESDNINKYLENMDELNNNVILNSVLQRISYTVESNNEIEEHYKKLLNIRNKYSDIFKNGKFRILEVYEDKNTKKRIDEDIENYVKEEIRKAKVYKNEEITLNKPHVDFVSYEIYTKNKSIMVIINNSDNEYPLNLKVSKLIGFYKDLMNKGNNFSVFDRMINVILKPYEVKILYNNGKYF